MSSHYLSSHHGGSHYLSNHYGRTIIEIPPEFTPDDVPHPPGMGRRIKQIREEDEIIMAIIMAFMETRK